MYQQRPLREVTPDEATPPLWQPPVFTSPLLTAEEHADVDVIEARASDKYAVVDDLMYDKATLAVCPWPRRNALGGLTFEPSRGVVVATEALYKRLVKAREGQVGADRPVRISDAFLIRRMPEIPDDGEADQEPAQDPRRWDLVVDVTADARDVAKVALYSAVAPALTPGEADRFTSSGDEPLPPPEIGPRAQPAV